MQLHTPYLQRLLDETNVAPVVNQIELHPLLQQRQLRAWNATHHIATESWSPAGAGGEGVRPAADQGAGRKIRETPAQIVVRWHLDNGLIGPEIGHAVAHPRNLQVFDFKLDKDELGEIAELDVGNRLGPDPDTL